ncbi:MAG: hypothetical protein LBV63_00800 [Candidatus Methanoplasma sp.]|jgi:hypothetical protein|nr:hypothetical protein [Candidatus Methanoplasma sp.]
MSTTPKKITAGLVLGIAGGFISVAYLAIFFEANVDNALIMGGYLLTAVLFFALAGAFTQNGPWSWNVLLFMTFLTAGAIAALVIGSYVDLYAGAVLVAIDVLIVLDLLFPSAKVWLDGARI